MADTPDVAQLITQMHGNIDSIHKCMQSLSDTKSHDDEMDKLEKKRENKIAELRKDHENTVKQLAELREKEQKEVEEKRRQEEEELMERRRREDEERKERIQKEEEEWQRLKQEEDEKKSRELEEQQKTLQEAVEEQLEKLEDEMEKRVEEGRKMLQELDEKRRAINAQIEAALNKPTVIPTITYRSRARTIGRKSPTGPPIEPTKEVNGAAPESAVETNGIHPPEVSQEVTESPKEAESVEEKTPDVSPPAPNVEKEAELESPADELNTEESNPTPVNRELVDEAKAISPELDHEAEGSRSLAEETLPTSDELTEVSPDAHQADEEISPSLTPEDDINAKEDIAINNRNEPHSEDLEVAKDSAANLGETPHDAEDRLKANPDLEENPIDSEVHVESTSMPVPEHEIQEHAGEPEEIVTSKATYLEASTESDEATLPTDESSKAGQDDETQQPNTEALPEGGPIEQDSREIEDFPQPTSDSVEETSHTEQEVKPKAGAINAESLDKLEENLPSVEQSSDVTPDLQTQSIAAEILIQPPTEQADMESPDSVATEKGVNTNPSNEEHEAIPHPENVDARSIANLEENIPESDNTLEAAPRLEKQSIAAEIPLGMDSDEPEGNTPEELDDVESVSTPNLDEEKTLSEPVEEKESPLNDSEREPNSDILTDPQTSSVEAAQPVDAEETNDASTEKIPPPEAIEETDHDHEKTLGEEVATEPEVSEPVQSLLTSSDAHEHVIQPGTERSRESEEILQQEEASTPSTEEPISHKQTPDSEDISATVDEKQILSESTEHADESTPNVESSLLEYGVGKDGSIPDSSNVPHDEVHGAQVPAADVANPEIPEDLVTEKEVFILEGSAEAVETGHESQPIDSAEEKSDEPHEKLDIERELPTPEETALHGHIKQDVPALETAERTQELQEESAIKKQTPATEERGSVDNTKEESLAPEPTAIISDEPQKESMMEEDSANKVSPADSIEASSPAEEETITLPEMRDIEQETPDVDGDVTKHEASPDFVNHAVAEGKTFDEDNHPAVDESPITSEDSKQEADIRDKNHESDALDTLDPKDTKHNNAESEEVQHPEIDAEPTSLADSKDREQSWEVDTTPAQEETAGKNAEIEHVKEHETAQYLEGEASSTGLEGPEDREQFHENDTLPAQEELEGKGAEVEHEKEPEETLAENSSPEHAEDHLIPQGDHVEAPAKETAEEHPNESNNLVEPEEESITHEQPGDADTELPSHEEESSSVSNVPEELDTKEVPSSQHLSNGTGDSEHNEPLESNSEKFKNRQDPTETEVEISQKALHEISNEAHVNRPKTAGVDDDEGAINQELAEAIERGLSVKGTESNDTPETAPTMPIEADSEKLHFLEPTVDKEDALKKLEPEENNLSISQHENSPDHENIESEKESELLSSEPSHHKRDLTEDNSVPETEEHPLTPSQETKPTEDNLVESAGVEPETNQAVEEEALVPESHDPVYSSHETSPALESTVETGTTPASKHVLTKEASDSAHQIPATAVKEKTEDSDVSNASEINPVVMDPANGRPSMIESQDSVDPVHERAVEFASNSVSEQLSKEDEDSINQVSAESHEKEPESEHMGSSHDVVESSSDSPVDDEALATKAIPVVEEESHPIEVATEAEKPFGEPETVASEDEENGRDHSLPHPIEHLASGAIPAENASGETEAESEPVSFAHDDAKKSSELSAEHVPEESPIILETTDEKTDEKPASESAAEEQLSKVLTAAETESIKGKEDTGDGIVPDQMEEAASETRATREHTIEPESIPQSVPSSTGIEEHPGNQFTAEPVNIPKAETNEREVIAESPEIPPRSPAREVLNKELDDQPSMPPTETTVAEISQPDNLEKNPQTHAASNVEKTVANEMPEPHTQPTDHILDKSLPEDHRSNDGNASRDLNDVKVDKVPEKDDSIVLEQENEVGNYVPEASAAEIIETVAPMTTLDFLRVNEGDSDGESEATEAMRSAAFMPSEEAWPSHQNLDDGESMHSPIRDHPTVLHEIYEDPEEHAYPAQQSTSNDVHDDGNEPVLREVERPSTPIARVAQTEFDHRMAESPVTVMNADNLFDSDDEDEDDDKENDYQPDHLAYGHHEDAHSRDLPHDSNAGGHPSNRGSGLFASFVDAIRPDISLVRQLSDRDNIHAQDMPGGYADSTPAAEGSISDYENLLDHGTPAEVSTRPSYVEENDSSLHIRTHTADTVPSFENYAHSDEDSTPSTPIDEIVDLAQDALHHERLIRSSWPVAPDAANFSDLHEDHTEDNRGDDRGSKPQPSPIHEEFDPYNPQQYPNYMPITPKSSIANFNQAPNSPTTSIRSVRHEEVYRPRDISISPLQSGNSSSTMLNRSPRFPPLNTTTAPERPYDSPPSRTSSLTDQPPVSPSSRRLRRPTISQTARTPNSSPVVPPASTPSSFFQKTRSLFESSSVAQPSSFPTSAVPRPLSGIFTAVRGGSSPKKSGSVSSLNASSRPSSLHRQSISADDEEGEEVFMPRSLDANPKPPSPGFTLPQMPSTSTSSRNGSLKANSVHNSSGSENDADFYTPMEDQYPSSVVGKRKSFLENLGGFGKAVGGLEDSIYNPARDQEARKKEGTPLLGQDAN